MAFLPEVSGDHLRLAPECGICSDRIMRREKVVAVYTYDRDEPTDCQCTRPFPFPPSSRTIVGGFILCCYPNCSRCLASPECSPMHGGCYDLFMAASDTKDIKALHRRLWLFTAWKRPWRMARPLYLPIRSMHVAGLKQAAKSLGLPELSKFPPELLDQIRDNSNKSLFWKCVSALSLALDESDDLDDELVVLQLDAIVSWERHGPLKLALGATLPPMIRITMDADGISKVERLHTVPTYAGERHKHYAYIVVDEEVMSKAQAQL
ncbi:hypothetical protein J3F83DRAFT_37397 [Trichoderma novae-zelandiae]